MSVLGKTTIIAASTVVGLVTAFATLRFVLPRLFPVTDEYDLELARDLALAREEARRRRIAKLTESWRTLRRRLLVSASRGSDDQDDLDDE